MAYIDGHMTMEGGGGFHDDFFHNYDHNYNFQDDDPMFQLDNARLNRSGYYRRMEKSRTSPLILQTLVRDDPVSNSVVVKEKGISEGGLSETSLPRVPEPHPSWRFYTSFDNGEWKRHMVPVYHSEKDVLNTSPGIATRSPLHSDSSFSFETTSPTYAVESSIRRMRLGRPSVYESLQNRRQRVSGEHSRMHGPRSAETILNSVVYLPSEELRKRYNYEDYSPKRRTEYGERVIYPRVKSDSVSSAESGFKKLSTNVSEEDEVTRSVHPSCLQVEAPATFEFSKAEGRPPSHDYTSGEKIIIPTKYKQGNNPPSTPARTILDMVDNPRDLMSPPKERLIIRKTLSPSPRRSINNSSHYITSNDDFRHSSMQPQHRGRSREVSSSSVGRTQEPAKEVKVLLVNPSVNQHITTVNTRAVKNYKTDDAVRNNEVNPISRKDFGQRSSSHNREIYIQKPQQIVQQNQQNNLQQHQNFHENQNLQQHQIFQQQQQSAFSHPTTQSSRRADELAARVKANTMATVQQMQDRMMIDMKDTCPQMAETMDSLLSGKTMEGVSVEKKQMSVEQSNMWQSGKPVEGTVTREAKVFTNDPISGPQDYVERSSVCQNLSDIPDGPTFIQHPFLQMSDNNNSNRSTNSSRYPSSVFFTPEPTFNDKPKSFIKNPASYDDHNNRSQQQFASNNSTKHTNDSNYLSSNIRNDNSSYATERVNNNAFKEKIIIPTKYKETSQETRNYIPNSSSRINQGISNSSSRMTQGLGGDSEVSRSFQRIIRQDSSEAPEELSFQAQSFDNPTSHNLPDSSIGGRSSSKSNFNLNSVRNNNNINNNINNNNRNKNKDWSFEMALNHAI